MSEIKNIVEGGKKKSSRGRSKTRLSSTKSKSKSRSSSKSKKSSHRRRKMHGGEESWGATGLPPSWFNARAPVPSYSADSGFGARTAYGPASPLDIGKGLLAPYNTNINGNQASMEKVGGKKKVKKTKKSKKSMRGGGLIPYMRDSAVVGIQKIVGNTVDGINDYLKSLDKNFDKSVKAAESVKIGDQRLIQQYGGKKKSTKSSSLKKKSKKTKKTTKRRRSMRGGDGSDFALTLNSRGPTNYPDNGWYNGEQLFRQFTKTGDYIPNSQLPYAAAPISTLSNIPKGGIVTGFDNLGQQWAPIK